ncbi:Bcmot2 [Botrytis cinerea B05.10]|uniref:Bcmot2 n=2 Tax=Botryotinia fuckeliana TaxID=40559 RepID=A0A384K0J3_BOTFB|nr:Bcmot2 [Botrytis cinerea B05.10]XP_024552482.1 Bcmot2 [Botrytis cinerea B05.10]ATZ56289.1 Bcmot2 [Botrytis cinerea B05.10]ATZ56291.1 Bcmot2 [Botrytis cinerea B05.10]
MAPQDSFIDEDDDTCPLCVEEFDLSDKNFQPCPCGYQICQFCYNNIKNNINGLCPACRRAYDEKTIKWKVVTPEEVAQFKANVQKNAKKKAEIRQKEAQKREVESLNRKHLAGLRVVQKNLVYVNGLSPSIREDELLQTLRGEKYFGQYGKILKIVVSKSKQNDSGQNFGVYVTFASKLDAERCITAVNGSTNGDRVLRAQLGTTKYCSAYLRNENCTNKNCMFLHEPGDNDDSYSRQDLSSINSVNSQRPLPTKASSSRTQAQAAPPIQQAQPLAAAAQPMAREGSKDDSDNGDGPALPSTANWANRGVQQQRSRRGSHATSAAAPSPAISNAIPSAPEAVEEETPELVEDQEESSEEASPIEAREPTPSIEDVSHPEKEAFGAELLRSINSDVLSWDGPKIHEDDLASFPPLFDDHGGEKRRLMREQQQEEERLHMEQESQADLQSVPEPVEEQEPESGSLQLGGEPEDNGREINQPPGFQRRQSSQLPIQRGSTNGPFGPSLGQQQNYQNISNLGSVNGRSLTPLQQSQLSMFKSPSGVPPSFMDHISSPVGLGNPLNQNNALFQQPGHNRQSSRYSFAGDGAAGPSSIKPSANSKMMQQQASMMPPSSHPQQGFQSFNPSIPAPPGLSGLKSNTPPIGGGMFGQGHGFGNTMGGGSAFGGANKENGSEMLREILRGRPSAGGNQGLDTSKLDLADPSILQARMQHQQQSNAGVGQGLFGQAQEDSTFDESILHSVDALVSDSVPDDSPMRYGEMSREVSRSSTPAFPPGLPNPHGHPPPAIREDPIGKPSKTISVAAPFTPSRQVSMAYPPRIATPLAMSQPSTPSPVKSKALPAPAPTPAPEILASEAQTKHETKGISSSMLKDTAAQSSTVPVVPTTPSHPAATTPATPTPYSTDDFPALGTQKETKPAPKKVSKSVASSSKAPSTSRISNAQKGTKASEQKTAPSVLTISASTNPTTNIVDTIEKPSQNVAPTSDFPSLPVSAVSAVRPPYIHKVLTINSSALKGETVTMGSPAPTSATSVAPYPAHFPDTTSEHDNASLMSATASRASSPGPSRNGQPRPTRNTAKTKRDKAAKKEQALEDQMAAAAEAKKVGEQEPIMGRKTKKRDRPNAKSAPSAPTSAPSRPPSPPPVVVAREESKPAEPIVPEKHVSTSSDKPVNKSEGKGKNKAKGQQPTPLPEAPKVSVVENEEIVEKRTGPSPASLAPFVSNLSEILKTPPGISNERKREKDNFGPAFAEALAKLDVSPEERAELNAGNTVHKIASGSIRIMLTPNGDCVRNLTPDEEKRYLELQARIAANAGPTAFVSGLQNTGVGFNLVGGRAVPNGPASYFPTSMSTGNTTPMDAVSKIQRDEALNYINQYVLPSLSNNPQLEKALSANVLAGDTALQGSETSSWSPLNGNYHAQDFHDMDLNDRVANYTAGFAGHRNSDDGRQDRNVQLLTEKESESAMQIAKKETQELEKRLLAVLKKNRKLLTGH